jgi:hypothetical protein
MTSDKVMFAFCEPISATTRSREHIRAVGAEGFKYGGGIPNRALCGWDVRGGWDLKAVVHPSRFLPNAETNPTCEKCIDAYMTPRVQPETKEES